MDRIENHPLIQEKVEWQINLGLERVKRICEELGNPHLKHPSVIVGGTNGKGFVVNFLHSLLFHKGIKVGSYYSPHLEKITERFRINHSEAEEAEILEAMDNVYRTKKILCEKLTYFEALTCSAFVLFSSHPLNWVILEVGLGGRLDATNIAEPEVSVLTNVSFDHENYLGNTLEKIAMEKAGIVRSNKPVILGENNPLLISAVKTHSPSYIRAFERDFTLSRKGRKCVYRGKNDVVFSLPENYPDTFLKNIAVSLATAEEMNIPFTDEEVESVIKTTRWKGRLELIKGNPSFIMDGGHNPHALRELLSFISSLRWDNPVFIVGFMKDKRIKELLNMLNEVSRDIFAVPLPYTRSWNPTNYENLVSKIYHSPEEAFKEALKRERNIVICGSLYLVGLMRKQVLHYAGSFPLNLK